MTTPVPERRTVLERFPDGHPSAAPGPPTNSPSPSVPRAPTPRVVMDLGNGWATQPTSIQQWAGYVTRPPLRRNQSGRNGGLFAFPEKVVESDVVRLNDHSQAWSRVRRPGLAVSRGT